MVAKKPVEDTSDLIIWQGATQTQLSTLFAVNHVRVKQATTKIAPCGQRNGRDLYKVSEVAPLLVRPNVTPEQLEKFLKESDHHALPSVLRKEFWVAMRQRQEYELKAGDLWPTTKVIEHVSVLVKLINMSMRLMTDTVERQVELTDRQRQIVKEQCDGMLLDLQKAMRDHFGKDAPRDVPDIIELKEDYDDEI